MQLSFTSTLPMVTLINTPMAVIGADPENVVKVLALRAQGLGYVAIDAAFGIHGKRGWWSWKIVRDANRK
jgi:hypothetical protein